MIPALAVTVLCFAISAGLTLGVRTFALRNSMMDVPNERSSHTTPTPRGGGAAIAAAALGGIAGAGALGWLPGSLAAGLLGGGVLVAGVGWVDDQGHVPAPLRAAVHVAAASLVLWSVGGLPVIRLGLITLSSGWWGTLFGVLGIVWMTNLYNFMDGIDGLAAGEAASAASVAGLLLWLTGAPTLATVSWIIAASAAGFLWWNWPPARIFMGDVGSGLLGFLFGAMAIVTEAGQALPGMVWALLLAVFVVDATATLLRRMLRGERWYSPHRQHAYQRAVRAGYSHGQVSAAVLGINLLLGAAALVAVARPTWQPQLLGAAYLALILLYLAVERIHPMESETAGAERNPSP